MKNKILTVAAIVICLTVLGTGTLAFFSDEAVAHNVITSGGVDIDLLEWGNKEKTELFVNPDGVMPGDGVTKIVEVKNTGASDAWVRIRLEQTIELTDAPENFRPDFGVIGLDINETDWTLQSEENVAYYYYNLALKPGETTVPLFTSVDFDDADMGNEYRSSTIEMKIQAQAVQTANNGTTALEAAGWPVF